jgi:hypothetical protein
MRQRIDAGLWSLDSGQNGKNQIKYDKFVKSLQFALLIPFDPALGGTRFASLNCKNSG